MLLWLVLSIFVTWTKFLLRPCAACGISARQTYTSVFCSQFCIAGGCAWVSRSLNVCSFSCERFLLPDLHSKKLCVSFQFAEHMLLQSGMVSTLSSIFQEPLHEFSALRSCLGWPAPLDQILLLVLLIPSPTWLTYSFLKAALQAPQPYCRYLYIGDFHSNCWSVGFPAFSFSCSVLWTLSLDMWNTWYPNGSGGFHYSIHVHSLTTMHCCTLLHIVTDTALRLCMPLCI
jgi:hypothetical protein